MEHFDSQISQSHMISIQHVLHKFRFFSYSNEAYIHSNLIFVFALFLFNLIKSL
uniref:Uncharacterized protein n=1 Tax=Solanum lycopersicum TaxID=4081 RepID=A0A3Q7J7A6_SOLLC